MTDTVRDAIEASIATIVPVATTPSTTTYGIDLVCVEDLDPKLKETRDDTVESLAQDLFHRVATQRGGVADALDFGDDVASYLSGDAQPTDLRSIEGRVASECLKDDRVDRVEVVATADAGLKSMTITIYVVPQDPRLVAFTLIIPVTDGQAVLEAILKETG